jgi:hypothetical protein
VQNLDYNLKDAEEQAVREPGGKAFQTKILSQYRMWHVLGTERVLGVEVGLFGLCVGKLGWDQNLLCVVGHGEKSGFCAKCNENPLMI